MKLKLLPRLSGKLGHVLVPTELKVFGELCKRIHAGRLAVNLTQAASSQVIRCALLGA